MAAGADPLRSTLDTLELDPRSEADRPYLVAMLRRLGYTERQIEEVVRTGRMPESGPDVEREPRRADDGLAPARDYRLVVPARETRFALEPAAAAAAPATDAPFEDLERLEFEDASQEVEFEDVSREPPAAEPTWEEPAEPTWEDTQGQPAGAPDERLEEGGEGQPAEEAWTEAPPEESRLDAAPLETFGNPDAVAGPPKTRVRVRRVRAASREEAERKVAGEGRNVIKSVPVDIVERWGQASKDKAKAQPPKEGDEA